MCDPVSMAATSFALSSASAMSSYNAQKQQASAGRSNAMTAYRDNQASINTQGIEDRAASSQDSEEQARATLQAESSARVAAGENGVMGNSIDALFRQVSGNGARNQSSIYENLVRSSNSLGGQQRSNVNTTTSTLNQYQKPSGLAAGLQIASAGANSYSGYKSGTFGKHDNMWK